MALVLKDRVRVTSFTGGSGTLTLGLAVQGFQDFSVIGDGNTTYYGIVDPATGDWEVGIGTYTSSGTTLSRDTILESSSGGTAVNFAGNPKDVFVTYPAERSVYVDGTTVTPAVASRLAFANLAQGSALSVLGVTGNATADNASIAAASDHQVLRRSGTSVGFGAVDIGQANAITGVLPAANGGTGVNNSTRTLTISSNSGTLNFTAASKTLGISNSLTLAGTDATTMTFPSTSATIARTDAGQTFTGTQVMTSPRIVTSINDTNGNEVFGITATGSAVNELTVANAATGNNPTISATGSDTNIGITLTPKGTGGVVFPSGAVGTPAITTSGDTNTGIFFPAADTIAFAEGGAEAMRIDSSGNVGIGTSSPVASSLLTLKKTNAGGDGAELRLINSSTTVESATQIVFTNTTTDSGNSAVIKVARTLAGQDFRFSSDGTERARITSDGFFKASNTGSYVGSTSNYHEFTNTTPDWSLRGRNTHASDPYGIRLDYTGASPNNTANDFLLCSDSTALRAEIRSNGGLANYSANNANLSDRREKTNFAPAKNYLDTICAIPVQTFNYIDQNLEEDDGLTLGVVAQDVQEVAPELVMESNWGTQEEPKMRLSIYQTDLQYALMKSIQELKTINDAQAQTINALEARISALEQA